jgi:hypothetical protein
MFRTPKYYADTLKDPLVMEDEACARIMEATDTAWVSSLYISLVYGQNPQVLSGHTEGSLGDGG